MTTRIALVVFPGFQIIDLAAISAFEMANLLHPGKPYEVTLVSAHGGLVPSSSGVSLDTRPMARRSFDTVMVGGATEMAPSDPVLLAELRRLAPRTRRLASICTGAFILAEAGIVDQGIDTLVPAQDVGHLRNALGIGQVGADGFHGTAGLFADAFGYSIQPFLVACHQDQVMAPAGQAVGIDGTDAARCPDRKSVV